MKFQELRPLLAGAVIACALAGCASGGGRVPTDPGGEPPVPPPPPPSIPVPGDFETAEYNRQYGLAQMNASHAYANDAFGEGVTIAVIDSGIDDSFAELAGALHPDSTSIWEEQGGTLGDVRSGHGTAIGAVIRSRRNNIGTHGVAPDATLLDIRVDRGVENTTIGGSFPLYTETDFALAIDYAIEHGADIISLSIARPESFYENGGADIYAALRRAVDAGILITIGTANYSPGVALEDRIVGPDWVPVAFAADPAMNGQIVVVPALNAEGTIADFSARAGDFAQFAISAAGQDVFISLDADTTANVNGVSFAGPQIAGALALLMSAFPNLTGEDALEILYNTARDLGEAGIDDIYGHGVPDMEAAFTPDGQSQVKLASGENSVSLDTITAAPTGAFGDWAWQSGLFQDAVFQDSYNRVFSLQSALSQRRPQTVLRSPFDSVAATMETPVRITSFGANGHVALRAKPDQVRIFSQLDDDMLANEPGISMTFRQGDFELSAGRGFGSPSILPGAGQAVIANNAFTGDTFALGLQRNWTSFRWNDGALGVVVRASGDTQAGAQSAALTYNLGLHDFAFEVGAMTESGSSLGSHLTYRLGQMDESRSGFQAVSWSGLLPGDWLGAARIELAQARPAMPSGFELVDPVMATAWAIGAERGFRGGQLGLTLSQPLRVEQGSLRTSIATGVDENWNLVYAEREGALAPSGREMSAELAYRAALWGADFTLASRYTVEPAHIAQAADTVSVWVGLRAQM